MKQQFQIEASLRDALNVAAIINDVNLAAVYNLEITQQYSNVWLFECKSQDMQYLDEEEMDIFIYDIEQVFNALEVTVNYIN